MERSIKNFRINKKDKNAYKISVNIIKLIDRFSKSNNSKLFIKEIADIFNIPKKTLEIKYKQLLHNTINYKSGIFSKVLSTNIIIFLKELIKSIYLGLLVIFSSKKKRFNSYDFILNGIEDKRSFDRYRLLINKFKKPLVISKRKLAFKEKNVSFFYNSLFFTTSSQQLNGKKKRIFCLFLKTILMSIKHGFNYLYFLNLIIFSILKNFRIFEENRGKYYMEDRFYNTCSIRNYYFKKFGGILTSTPQKNILETCISYYIDTDIFFSLAEEKYSGQRIKILGGNIKKTIPVGSFFLEHDWYSRKRDHKSIPKIDILFMGMNPNDWLYINNENYYNYEHLNRSWIKKISLQYPKLNIKIKHHANFSGSEYENNFFKNTNVEILENKSINFSYGYMNNSKIIFSFGSTTTLEAISMHKAAYFIDPFGRGKNFYYGLKNLDKIRIKNYSQLNRIINENLFLLKKVNLKKKEYCLKSDNVSNRVFKFYKNYK